MGAVSMKTLLIASSSSESVTFCPLSTCQHIPGYLQSPKDLCRYHRDFSSPVFFENCSSGDRLLISFSISIIVLGVGINHPILCFNIILQRNLLIHDLVLSHGHFEHSEKSIQSATHGIAMRIRKQKPTAKSPWQRH